MRRLLIFGLIIAAIVFMFVTTLTGAILDFLFTMIAVILFLIAIAIAVWGMFKKKAP